MRSYVAVRVFTSERRCVPRRFCSSGGSPSRSARDSFRSSTRFKLSPHEVNETNVPSAREASAMIPSLSELRRQLPTARELERQYVQQRRAAPPPLWPNSDTPEEIMEEERHGSAEGQDEVPPPSPQDILLAWRALLWGSLYAAAGVCVIVAVSMYVCGVNSIGEALEYLRGRENRERLRLEASGVEVHQFVLDLTNPLTIVQQANDIWRALEELSNKEELEETEKQCCK